jgi:hypothetical protein
MTLEQTDGLPEPRALSRCRASLMPRHLRGYQGSIFRGANY